MLIYINQLNNHTHLIIIMKGGKAIFLLIPDDISIQESSKEINVKVDFCDTARLMETNYIYYKDDGKNYVFIRKNKKTFKKSY